MLRLASVGKWGVSPDVHQQFHILYRVIQMLCTSLRKPKYKGRRKQSVLTSSVRRLPALQYKYSWNTPAAKKPAWLARSESARPGLTCNATFCVRHYATACGNDCRRHVTYRAQLERKRAECQERVDELHKHEGRVEGVQALHGAETGSSLRHLLRGHVGHTTFGRELTSAAAGGDVHRPTGRSTAPRGQGSRSGTRTGRRGRR